MSRENVVASWLEHVHEDISAAEDMYKTGHWLYVGFLCHQAVEKAFKAYFVATTEQDPPYTHSHMRLADVCGLAGELSDQHLRFIDFMVPMYIKARYPEQKIAASQKLNEKVCEYVINTTKELIQWIEQRLPNNKHSMS